MNLTQMKHLGHYEETCGLGDGTVMKPPHNEKESLSCHWETCGREGGPVMRPSHNWNYPVRKRVSTWRIASSTFQSRPNSFSGEPSLIQFPTFF